MKEDEKNEMIIRRLLKLPENKRCINCGSQVSLESCTSLLGFQTGFDGLCPFDKTAWVLTQNHVGLFRGLNMSVQISPHLFAHNAVECSKWQTSASESCVFNDLIA